MNRRQRLLFAGEPAQLDDLACDVLLFFSTKSEGEQLEAGAKKFGFEFQEKRDPRVGTYFSLGTIGAARVRAVRTRMGPFFYNGSASQAVILRAATSATSIIQIGMAFGIQRGPQNYGEVLVSEWIFRTTTELSSRMALVTESITRKRSSFAQKRA